MNKRQIIASLNKIANELDINDLHKEANSITKVMQKLAQEDTGPYNSRSTEDEDYTKDVMDYLFEILWSITPWKYIKENHPIHKFSGSEKIRFVSKKMRDILDSDKYATPQELRSIVDAYQDFLKMFMDSFISRKEIEISTEKLDNFLTKLNEAEKAINEGRAEEYYNSSME
jgi:hypothetical protein